MKKKYNIQLNPKRLSKEEIDRHKDFDALYKRYQRKPLGPQPMYRKLTFWIAAVAAAAVLALLLVYTGTSNEANYDQKMADYFDSQPFINRPLGQIEKKFVS